MVNIVQMTYSSTVLQQQKNIVFDSNFTEVSA